MTSTSKIANVPAACTSHNCLSYLGVKACSGLKTVTALQTARADVSNESRDDDDLCIVCWEQVREVIFYHCMHMVRSCGMCPPCVAMFLFVCRSNGIQSQVAGQPDAVRCCRSVHCRHHMGVQQESMLAGLHGNEHHKCVNSLHAGIRKNTSERL